MFSYVALTDGTSTCVLTDGIDYALIDYAPTISRLRSSDLGGYGPYQDVTEQLTCYAIGSSPAEALARAGAIAALLDQAARWARGENVAAVRVVIELQDPTPLRLSATLLGNSQADPLALSVTQTQSIPCKYVTSPITINFTRAGMWLAPREIGVQSAAVQVAFASAPTFSGATGPLPGPTRISIDPQQNVALPGGLVVMAITSGHVGFCDAFLTGSITADAGARNGTFERHTVAAGASTTILHSATDLNTYRGNRSSIFASVRTPGTGTWRLQTVVKYASSANSVTLPDVYLSYSESVNPRIVYLGEALTNVFPAGTIEVTITNTSSGSADFDVDYYMVVGRRSVDGYSEPTAQIVAVDTIASSTGLNLNIDPMALNRASAVVANLGDRPAPLVYAGVGGINVIGTYRGNAWLTNVGNSPVVVWAATDGTDWRLLSGGSPVTYKTTLERCRAYLIPE